MKTIKFLALVASLGIAALYGLSDNERQDSANYASFLIQAAQNLTNAKSALCDNLYCEYVSAKNKKLINPGLAVPFVSIKQYMKEFVRNIPYAPKESLKIETALGIYRLWQSESGVICAPDPETTDSDLWKSKILLKNRKNLSSIRLLLLIDQEGQIKLKGYRNKESK